METEPTVSTPVTPGPSAVEIDDKMETEEEGADKKESDSEKKDGEGEKKKRAEKEKVGYEVVNMARVLPEQLKYISFLSDSRYEPVKKACITDLLPSRFYCSLTGEIFFSLPVECFYYLIARPMNLSSGLSSRSEKPRPLLALIDLLDHWRTKTISEERRLQ